MRLKLLVLFLFLSSSTACLRSKLPLATTVQQASTLFREKRYTECIPLYKDLAARTYQQGFYYYMTARAYAALNDFPNCGKYLKKSIRYSPFYFKKYEDERQHFEGFLGSAQAREVNTFGISQLGKHNWQVDSVLLKKVLALSEQDQMFRKQIIAASRANDKVLYDSLRLLQQHIDTAVNTRFLALIAEKFPNYTNLGPEGASVAMAILQHVPHDNKVQLLPIVKKQVDRHYLPYAVYANLYDRVRMEAGQCQQYGTQQQITDGKPCLYCVENPSGLTERRAMIGLPPVDSSLSVCIKKAAH